MMKQTNSSVRSGKTGHTVFFKWGVVFSVIGGIYFFYNLVYMVLYASQNIDYYNTYGYETAEILNNLLPTLVSNFFTPIGIFGAAVVAAFGVDAILIKNTK